MDYNFEEFISEKGHFTPVISLGRAGGLGISSGFTKKYPEVKNAVGVKLFYDKSKNAVGVKFINTKEDGMARVKFGKRGDGFINGKAFMIKFGIDKERCHGKYSPKETDLPNNQGKVFVIELKEKKGE